MALDFLRRRPLVGGLVGAPPAGAAFLLHYPGARFRHPLAAVLPLSDANGEVLATAAEALRRAGSTPLLAGLCATDPTRIPDRLLDEAARAGYAGVLNAPSVGLFDGIFRSNLESTGLGYVREIELIGRAAARGLAAVGLAFTADEARRMAEAGAHALVLHPGPAGALTPALASEIASAVRSVRPEVPLLAAADAPLGLDGHVSGVA